LRLRHPRLCAIGNPSLPLTATLRVRVASHREPVRTFGDLTKSRETDL